MSLLSQTLFSDIFSLDFDASFSFWTFDLEFLRVLYFGVRHLRSFNAAIYPFKICAFEISI